MIDLNRNIQKFFAFAKTRHNIYIKRQTGAKYPWTTDPILGTYRFTNIYRELDATTIALRVMTDTIFDQETVLPFIIQMRWLNRRETWKTMLDYAGGDVCVLADHLVSPNSLDKIKDHIVKTMPYGPWVTGAYIIKTPNGMNKLDGVFDVMKKFVTQQKPFRIRLRKEVAEPLSWYHVSNDMLQNKNTYTLEDTWEWLKQFECQGQFTAYEAVSDFRHTDLLNSAPDIMTWANAGPGAMRGLNRIYERSIFNTSRSTDWQSEMQNLLRLSQQPEIWPSDQEYWKPWEMREVEHTLCEFDKYERVRLKEGHPRGKYP